MVNLTTPKHLVKNINKLAHPSALNEHISSLAKAEQ